MIPPNLPVMGLMMRRFREILPSCASCRDDSAESSCHGPHDAKISRNLVIIPFMSACFGEIFPSSPHDGRSYQNLAIMRRIEHYSTETSHHQAHAGFRLKTSLHARIRVIRSAMSDGKPIKPVENYSRMPVGEVIRRSQAVADNMEGNPKFPKPQVRPKDL